VSLYAPEFTVHLNEYLYSTSLFRLINYNTANDEVTFVHRSFRPLETILARQLLVSIRAKVFALLNHRRWRAPHAFTAYELKEFESTDSTYELPSSHPIMKQLDSIEQALHNITQGVE
jgi:hypothetical protein